jgi:hypothetical protein
MRLCSRAVGRANPTSTAGGEGGSNRLASEGVRLQAGQLKEVVNEIAVRELRLHGRVNRGRTGPLLSAISKALINEVLRPDGREHFSIILTREMGGDHRRTLWRLRF